jgi:hypothetical protein
MFFLTLYVGIILIILCRGLGLRLRGTLSKSLDKPFYPYLRKESPLLFVSSLLPKAMLTYFVGLGMVNDMWTYARNNLYWNGGGSAHLRPQ